MLAPFEVLVDADGPRYPLPRDLEEIYGPLGFTEPVVYGNFVSSLDGVVTLGDTLSAGSVLSGRYPADRFLMGLLRACADAVLVGAGTLRATPGHLWTPAHVFPELRDSFAGLRRGLHREAEPRLVVLTGSGDVDASHPALAAGATIMTTAAGASRIGDRLPACEIVEVGKGKAVDVGVALDEMARRGWRTVLTEGGPHVIGELVKARRLDEAWLTLSPVLAGRDKERRLGMVEGVELLPIDGVWSRLQSVRRHGNFLFLRHRLNPAEM